MHPLKLKVEQLDSTNKASAPVLNHFVCCKQPHSFPKICCTLFSIQTCGGLEKPQSEYGKIKNFWTTKCWVCDEVIIMGRKWQGRESEDWNSVYAFALPPPLISVENGKDMQLLCLFSIQTCIYIALLWFYVSFNDWEWFAGSTGLLKLLPLQPKPW